MYMDSRAKIISRAIRRFDSKLYCTRTHLGKYVIMRKGYKHTRYDLDNCAILALEPFDSIVMSLTHDWSGNGRPVCWGIEPILARLRDIDLHNTQSLVNRLEEENEKIQRSKDRDRRNMTEDAVRELRPYFAKATNDFITGSMKTDNRRKYEKRIKLN